MTTTHEAQRTETVTLIAAKSGQKHSSPIWHIAANGNRTLCKREIVAGEREPDVDRRVIRFKGRPVCSKCKQQSTTEEVTMSTTEEVTMASAAPEATGETAAKTDAAPDPKNEQAKGQSQARTTRASGGRSSGRASTKASTKAASDSETPSIPDGLDKLLMQQVKKAVPKPELATSPSGSYTVVRSDGYKVATLHPQTRKGVLVLLALAPSTVKQHVKGAEIEKYEKNVIKSRLYVTAEDQVAGVAEAAKLAAREIAKA